jgi:hypothetical protein
MPISPPFKTPLEELTAHQFKHAQEYTTGVKKECLTAE